MSPMSAPARKIRPFVQQLEERDVPAAQCFLDASGVLNILGTARIERFQVRREAGQVLVTQLGARRSAPVGLGMYAESQVTQIKILCKGGNDLAENLTDKPC